MERAEIEPTVGARSSLGDRLPNTLFDAMKGTRSLDKDALARIKGRLAWPTFTRESKRSVAAATRLLLDMHQQNSWVLARTAWKAIVFQPGMIIGKVGTAEYSMVLDSNEFGIYLWPMRCDKKGSLCRLDTSANASAQWCTVRGFNEWQVVQHEVVSPVHVHFDRARARQPQPSEVGVAAHLTGTVRSVVVASALSGSAVCLTCFFEEARGRLGHGLCCYGQGKAPPYTGGATRDVDSEGGPRHY